MIILPIKKKWFEMIKSGEKKEEYREIKPYYTSRFSRIWGSNLSKRDIPQAICLRNGYSSNSPQMVVECTISIGNGKPEWGAEAGTEYYVLHICKTRASLDKDCCLVV